MLDADSQVLCLYFAIVSRAGLDNAQEEINILSDSNAGTSNHAAISSFLEIGAVII